MSMISKQIEELRFYAKDRKGELARLINDAADTIEMLSEKLHASNMERSSQYYNGGWIPCSERLPEHTGTYLVTDIVAVDKYVTTGWYSTKGSWICDGYVEAWMPLPEPYKGDDK